MNKKILMLIILCFFVFFSCSAEKKDWKNAESENTIAAYEAYLKTYPQGKYADSANAGIEELVWQSTLKDNTINGYEAYLKTYPQGKYADSANAGIEELVWQSTLKDNTINGYEAYLKTYPQGKYANSASNKINEIWSQAALNASKQTKEVILTTKASSGTLSVIPYGRNKLITIFNPQVFVGNRIKMSYKLEKSMEEKPVLVASFTEANIAAMTSRYYYFEYPNLNMRYDMSEKTITFNPNPGDWVFGKTKVSIYFITKKDLESLSKDVRYKAVSNVITLYLNY